MTATAERSSRPGPGRAARLRSTWHTRTWPIALVLAVPAAAAVLLNDPRRYVGDNRFEQYWGPAWRLGRETMLWDGTRGMGRVGEEFWPITVPLALLRGLGLSPAVTQHVWHATLLLLAGLGAVQVVRLFQPRIGDAHLVAGLAYMFNPFSIVFLVPSNLYSNYVLAPWLLVVALRGIRGEHPWRHAAAFALLAFVAGDTDPPGLVFACLWLVPATIMAVAVERWATWRSALAWVGRAALLTVATTAAALTKVVLGSGPLAQRLLYTESPSDVNQTSSWSESWRGLGYWLTYFRTPGRDIDVPGALPWFESTAGVLITFVLPVAALVAAWRLRWRSRLLFVAIAVPSLVLMVGSYPPDDPSPFGRLLLRAYDTVPGLASMRNSYKAGSGLLIAVSVLAAIGVSALAAWAARRTRQPAARPLVGAAAVVVIGLVSLPVWTGGLYPDDRTMGDIPDHWRDAAAWIEQQPGDARVLVLPGSTQTAYRWGWAGDDILDTLLRRHANVVPTNFPVSGPLAADIVDAIGREARAGTLTADTLVPVARRLGVGWVVLRNDLDWARIREPRPALLDGLRDTAALPLAATFGEVGRYTASPDDPSKDAARERELPPIEIYEVPGVAGTQDLAVPDRPAVLVDGDGSALLQLAGDGALDDDVPVRFAGATTVDDLRGELDDGGRVVVTDTNRRRLTLIRGPGPSASETLAAGQELQRAPQDLFGDPSTQSVATFADATSISSSGSGSNLTGFTPSLRAANAFDGLLATAWRSGGLQDPTGEWVRVDLKKPHSLRELTLVPYRDDEGGRTPTKVSLHFSDGPPVEATLPADARIVPVEFEERTTDSIEVRIEEVEGRGTGPVGFSEIRVEGLDLAERIAVPSHLFDGDDDDVAMDPSQVSYRFQRSIGQARDDEELVIRRRFRTEATADRDVRAVLSSDTAPLDSLVDELLGGPVGAFGSSRAVPPVDGRGGLAVDGEPDTAWAGAPRSGENLTVRFPPQPVDTVTVTALAGPKDFPLTSVIVTVGTRPDAVVQLSPPPGCSGAGCPRTGTLTVPVTDTGKVKVTLREGDNGGRPARIAEVSVSGPEGDVPAATVPDRGACSERVLSIDREGVALRLDGDPLSALEDNRLELVSCDPLRLTPGDHLLDTRLGTRVDAVHLDPARRASGSAGPGDETVGATVVRRSPTEVAIELDGDGPAIVSTGQSLDAGWQASADGIDLGAPFEVAGQSAWRVPEGTRSVTMRYRPQRLFSTTFAVTLTAVALCAVVLLRGTRRSGPRRRGGRYRAPEEGSTTP